MVRVLVILSCFIIVTPSSDAIADGARYVKIPNVVRMPKQRAITTLRRAGVTGTIRFDQSLCGSVVDGHVIEIGQVCHQQPPAHRRTVGRLMVTIRVQTRDPRHGNVGRRGEWHLMPNVVGMRLARAKLVLRKAGFTTGRLTNVNYVARRGCKPGYVCSTNPPALRRHGLRSARYLTVGK